MPDFDYHWSHTNQEVSHQLCNLLCDAYHMQAGPIALSLCPVKLTVTWLHLATSHLGAINLWNLSQNYVGHLIRLIYSSISETPMRHHRKIMTVNKKHHLRAHGPPCMGQPMAVRFKAWEMDKREPPLAYWSVCEIARARDFGLWNYLSCNIKHSTHK